MNDLAEEKSRWETVIAQYKTEIGTSTIELNNSIQKGYLTKSVKGVAISEKCIGFMEGVLKSKGISEDAFENNSISEKIINLFNSSDYELDFMACSAIYASKYKKQPTEESLVILKKMLPTASIPQS